MEEVNSKAFLQDINPELLATPRELYQAAIQTATAELSKEKQENIYIDESLRKVITKAI